MSKTNSRTASSKSKSKGRKTSSAVEFTMHLTGGVNTKDHKQARGLITEWALATPHRLRELARKSIIETVIDSNDPEISEDNKLKFLMSCAIADRGIEGYATLDDRHSNDIATVIKSIETYIEDDSNRRPLNFLMLASPGAGKSHFIDCVARRLGSRRIGATTFNMASMSVQEELIRPLDEARNAKVEDKIPLLFLDEFDSSPNNYALLLPLLWDGSLSVGQRDLKLGKIIIFLAGSNPNLPEALAHAKSMRTEIPLPDGTSSKLIDLFSRINGSVLRIPPFFDAAAHIDRRADKVAIAVQLLRRRFGRQLKRVSLALLRLIARAHFRYDVRSIAHIINLIPFKRDARAIALSDLHLPIANTEQLRDSSLVYHLVDDENQAFGIVKLWEQLSGSKDEVYVGDGDGLAMLGRGEGTKIPAPILDWQTAELLRELRKS